MDFEFCDLKGLLYILIITGLLLSLTGMAYSADPGEGPIEEVRLTLSFEPGVPEPVETGLYSVILATLNDVLIENQSSGAASLRRHTEQVSLALKEGLNVVLEPKGFSLREIRLDIAHITTVEIGIVPAGGVSGEPGPACTGLEIELDPGEVSDFWHPVFLESLEAVRADAEAYYLHYTLGLPLVAADKSFITNAIAPFISDTSPVSAAFPHYTLTNELDIAETSILTIRFSEPVDHVRILRVRMSGDTVPNVVLDGLREAITSHSDIAVGMPRLLVQDNLAGIGEYFAAIVKTEEAAQFFDADTSIDFSYEDEDDSLIVLCEVRSGTYDINLRGYIDFGLEDADSGEVEGRVGYFMTRDFELMVVLNLYTTDMTLEPDALIGWRPREGSFFAGGYDIDAKDHKFFFSQRLGENFFCEGEIFGEDDRSQYGILYRFHQYFSGGLYATGDGDYWFRTTFRL